MKSQDPFPGFFVLWILLALKADDRDIDRRSLVRHIFEHLARHLLEMSDDAVHLAHHFIYRYGKLTEAEIKAVQEEVPMNKNYDTVMDYYRDLYVEEGMEKGLEKGMEKGLEGGWLEAVEALRKMCDGMASEGISLPEDLADKLLAQKPDHRDQASSRPRWKE